MPVISFKTHSAGARMILAAGLSASRAATKRAPCHAEAPPLGPAL